MARLVGMVGIVGIVGMVTMARTLKRAVIRLVSGHGHNSPGLHCEKMDSKLGLGWYFFSIRIFLNFLLFYTFSIFYITFIIAHSIKIPLQ